MKKIYTTLFLSALALFSFAQGNSKTAAVCASCAHHAIPVNIIKSSGNPNVMVVDTLTPPSFGSPMMCDTALVYYYCDAKAPNDTGYCFGNNAYGETQCAQKYYATGSITEVLVAYGHKAGTTGASSIKIYSIDGTTKGPSATVLGTSASVTTGNVTVPGITTYTFATAVAVTNSFAASVILPTTTGDTLAIITTKLGCSSTDSLSWENFPAFGGWLNTIAAFGVNLDCYILPVGTFSSSGINEYSSMGLSLLGAFPNPANDFTTIRLRLDESSKVSVHVFDLTGRVIYDSSDNLISGTHEIKISLKDVSSGNYYYTVKTNKTQLTSKFAVAK